MLIGPLIALFATAITSGTLIADVIGNISHMYARPCDDVAVNVLAPADADAVQTVKAECSDSTQTNSVPTSPSAT